MRRTKRVPDFGYTSAKKEQKSMKKYKAKVIHSVEIVLDDDSTLNTKEWLEIIASNLAYHKAGEHGRYISQEIVIEDMQGATEQKQIDEDAMHAIVEEQVIKAIEKQKAIDIDKGKVFIKDLLLSIIGCEPKEGWIEDIQNEYEKVINE